MVTFVRNPTLRQHRFYHPNLTVGRHLLSVDEAHHARSVLRINAGEAVELFDGECGLAVGEVVVVSRSEVVVEVGEISWTTFAGAVRLTLATAMPRKQRQGFLFEKCTELGVWAFWPTIFDRSVVKPGEGSSDKWRRTVVESCKQCGRVWVPNVANPLPLADVVSGMDAFDVCAVAGFSESSRPLIEVIRDARVSDDPLRVLVFIGPEGGMTEDEARMIEAPIVTLGRHTLRIETACVAATVASGLL